MKVSATAATGFWVAARSARAQSRSPNERFRVACIGVGGKGKVDAASVADAGADIVALATSMTRGPRTPTRVPEGQAVPRLPRDVRQDAQGDRRGHRQHAGPHARRPDHDGHEARQARLHAEAADAHASARPGCSPRRPEDARSSPRWATRAPPWTALREAVEVIQAGAIGPVKEVHVWTNRPIWPQGADALMQHEGVQSVLHGHGRPTEPRRPSTGISGWAAPRSGPTTRSTTRSSGAAGGTSAPGPSATWPATRQHGVLALKLGYPTSVEARVCPGSERRDLSRFGASCPTSSRPAANCRPSS